MSALKFQYDPDRTVEAIIYLVQKVRHPTKMSILKLLYFADKTSLERYGRFITGDQYYAMQFGPVATNAYRMMCEEYPEEDYGFSANGKVLVAHRQPNLGKLSKSDIECLDEMLSLYGHYPAWHLSEMTHFDSAWAKNWENRVADSNRAIIPLEDIVETLEDSEGLLEELRETNKKSS